MAAQAIPLDSLDLEADAHLSLRIDRQRCRFCQCTEDNPCAIRFRKDQTGNYLLAFDETVTARVQFCTWYIPGVCSNPTCVHLLIQESHEAARSVRMRKNG